MEFCGMRPFLIGMLVGSGLVGSGFVGVKFLAMPVQGVGKLGAAPWPSATPQAAPAYGGGSFTQKAHSALRPRASVSPRMSATETLKKVNINIDVTPQETDIRPGLIDKQKVNINVDMTPPEADVRPGLADKQKVNINADVTPPEADVRPGLIDKELFTNDPSCAVWEKFSPMDRLDPLENLQAAAAIPAKYMPKPFEALGGALRAIEYWGKHAARTSYFVANAVTGVAASTVLGDRSAGSSGRGQEFTMGGAPAIAAQQILQSSMVFEEDWQRIVRGSYAMPWDLSDGHRQNTPAYAVRQSARVVEETMEIMDRQKRNTPADRSIWLGSSDSIYPEYYKTNYHYQTDGWMSRRSADVYETSTEVIFFGRQDAMQRLSLLPLKDLRGAGGRPLRILEVACGTGRFGTFIRDNHPTAEVTYVDLSPFYLEKARENDDYWLSFRSGKNGGKPYEPAKFVQAAAEALPFGAGEFDAVVCVYLFHEMPEGPRAAAAAEMARVLAPGGTLVLSDSIQRGDRPILDDALVGFENLNEPHYRNYIGTPLADLFTRHGLGCGERFMACTSKTLSFTKPATR